MPQEPRQLPGTMRSGYGGDRADVKCSSKAPQGRVPTALLAVDALRCAEKKIRQEPSSGLPSTSFNSR